MSKEFELTKGTVITIPAGVVDLFRRSKNAEGHMDTPIIAWLDQGPKPPTGQPQLWSFITHERETDRIRAAGQIVCQHDGPRTRAAGKAIFLPTNLRAGDRVVIKWVDSTCACAVRQT